MKNRYMRCVGVVNMINTMKKLSLLLIVMSCWTFVHSQNQNFAKVKPEDVGLSADSLKKMNNHFHKLVDNGKLAGIQIAIIKNGKLVQFDSYGYSNIDEKQQIDEQSIFRIFSMTKPIVSVALLQLYEKKKFKL